MSANYTDADVQAAIRALDAQSITGSTTLGHYARAVLNAVAPAIAARALREAAETTLAEMVCCDEYEQRKAGSPRPRYPHHICYWGAAHAEALRDRADEIERT